MKILIIGASGLIGSALLNALRSSNIRVEGSSSRPTPDLRYLAPLDDAQLATVLLQEKFTTVVNCSSKGVVRGSATPSEMDAVNADLPGKLAKAISNLNFKCRLVHLSSSTEPLGTGLAESEYAKSKKKGTLRASEILSESNHILNIVRIHNVYATEPLPKRFLTEVAQAAVRGKQFQLHYPKRVRDFVHISDVVRSLKEIVTDNAQERINYEIGTGVGWNLETVVDMAYELAGSKSSLHRFAPLAVDDNHPYEVAGNQGFQQKIALTQLPQGLEMMMRTMV